MSKSSQRGRHGQFLRTGMVVIAVLLAGGCEMHSFLDPSVVGRWERTPVVLPILDQLDVIDEPSDEPPGLSLVQPEDLVSDVHEYVLGTGDVVTVTVYELLAPLNEAVQTRRIDELGMIRLPIIGPVKAEGRTPSELESDIADILVKKGVLNDPTVSVVMQEQRQNTFTVIGESTYASTAIGTYAILGKNFRLIDAMAQARGVPGQIKKLYVIRQAQPSYGGAAPVPSATPQTPPPGTLSTPPQQPGNPADLIQDLLKGPASQAPATPGVAQAQVETPEYEYVDGKWVRRGDKPAADTAVPAASAPASAPDGLPTTTPAPADTAAAEAQEARSILRQRVIEIPYDKLLEGDTQYNIVIRAGDVIRVPPPVIGNIYIGGAINRPGAYGLPGDKDLTLQQLIFSGGNLSPIAIPERVDLIRRIGKTQQATVRINLRAIFEGTAPDIFLKPNDTINVGTSFVATPLAVLRNGFRTSYGFGFVLDRNFDENVFGPRIGN